MIWLGASTKSACTLVPACAEYRAVVSVWCSTWPNSWKSVTTSLWVSSAGRSAVGAVMLARIAETGRW